MIVRPATPADVPAIHALVTAFASENDQAQWVRGSAASLHQALFGDGARCAAFVAADAAGVGGVALWFLTYHFWLGQPVLYLEDLYVARSARGAGVGEALMRALAAEAVARGCAWMDWQVLTENVAAQRFYARLGAVEQSEWRLWRLEGQALTDLAGTA